MGGELLRALVAGECPVPITRVRGFGVPHLGRAGHARRCASYSGDTAETLACARQAHRQGADVLTSRPAARWRAGAGVGSARRARTSPAGCSRGRRSATCSARWPARSAPAGSPPRGSPRRPRRASRPSTATPPASSGARLAGNDPADLRRRADGGGRLPVEDPDERERQDARLQPRASRARPQRDRGLGGGRRARLRRWSPCATRRVRRRSGGGSTSRSTSHARTPPRSPPSRGSATRAPRARSTSSRPATGSPTTLRSPGVSDPTPVAAIAALKRALSE